MNYTRSLNFNEKFLDFLLLEFFQLYVVPALGLKNDFKLDAILEYEIDN